MLKAAQIAWENSKSVTLIEGKKRQRKVEESFIDAGDVGEASSFVLATSSGIQSSRSQ